MRLKTLLLALLAASSVSPPAFAGSPTMACSPPVLQVPSDPAAPVGYTVICTGAGHAELAPVVTFAGELTPGASAGIGPYKIKATYTIDTRTEYAQHVNQMPHLDQFMTGQLSSSAISSAALPAQLAAQTVWDSTSGTLSVEAEAGVWHIYSTDFADMTSDVPSVHDAGLASAPVVNGETTYSQVLGTKYSRFAGTVASSAPVVKAFLRLRDGKLELMTGETQANNQAAVQGALLALDRKPGDLARAWALAARAQYLGLDDEVRYAERKVGVTHPELLEEFQLTVQRIKPFSR